MISKMAIQVGGGVALIGGVAIGGYVQQQSAEKTIKEKLNELLNLIIDDFKNKIIDINEKINELEKSENSDLLQQIVSDSEKIIDEIEYKKQVIKTQIKSTKASMKSQDTWETEFFNKLTEIKNQVETKINNIETYEPFGIKNKSKTFKERSWILLAKKNGNYSWLPSEWSTEQNKKSKDWTISIAFQNTDTENKTICTSYNNPLFVQFYQIKKDKEATYTDSSATVSKSDLETINFKNLTKENSPNKFVAIINQEPTSEKIVNISVFAASNDNTSNKKLIYIGSGFQLKQITISN